MPTDVLTFPHCHQTFYLSMWARLDLSMNPGRAPLSLPVSSRMSCSLPVQLEFQRPWPSSIETLRRCSVGLSVSTRLRPMACLHRRRFRSTCRYLRYSFHSFAAVEC